MPLTLTELASAVADRADISRAEAKRVLAALEEIVLEELGNAQKVRIGGLVQLTVRVKPAQKGRKGRNPATGEEITIAAKPADDSPPDAAHRRRPRRRSSARKARNRGAYPIPNDAKRAVADARRWVSESRGGGSRECSHRSRAITTRGRSLTPPSTGNRHSALLAGAGFRSSQQAACAARVGLAASHPFGPVGGADLVAALVRKGLSAAVLSAPR